LKAIFLVGFKHSGKSALGKNAAKLLKIPFVDIDDLILAKIKPTYNSIREFYKNEGEAAFVALERDALKEFLFSNEDQLHIIATGGGICDNKEAIKLMKTGRLIFLDVAPRALYKRIVASGFPPFIDKTRPKASFDQLYKRRSGQYRQISDYVLPLLDCRSVDENAILLAELINKVIEREESWQQIPLEQHLE